MLKDLNALVQELSRIEKDHQEAIRKRRRQEKALRVFLILAVCLPILATLVVVLVKGR